jgi:hypothetical protein
VCIFARTRFKLLSANSTYRKRASGDMHSRSIAGLCAKWGYGRISKWQPFDATTAKNAPRDKGTYVIRRAHGEKFGRLRGFSDILYIGSTESKRGLRSRLRQYLHPGQKKWTAIRVNQALSKYEAEVAWCENPQPRNLEHNLLRQYAADHDEFPPLNRADIRALKQTLVETL